MNVEQAKARLQNEAPVMTMFRDQHGLWAKTWAGVVDVAIRFADGQVAIVSYGDYLTLPDDMRRRIQHAPSGEVQE